MTLVLNGWASSPRAWDLCSFGRDALFSYADQLAGRPEQAFAEEGAHILVGWSMGGSSALRLACRFPDRIAGLVLVAATPRMMEDKAANWRGLSPRRLEALHYAIKLTHGEGFFGVPKGKPNPYQMDTDENLAGGIRYLLETDLPAALAATFVRHPENVRFPVHIFQSEHDGVVRPENAAYLKTIFPQASLTLVPGTEHALPIFIPELIDAAVADCHVDDGAPSKT